MKLIPAIDILNGKVVRLHKGAYDAVTIYSDYPDDFARRWVKEGAECIHLVDLDAARAGRLTNLESIKRIRETVDVELEYGGGVRSVEDADALFAIGMDRVIIGTSAFNNDMLDAVIKKYGERIAVSVDARDGYVKVAGWIDDSQVTYMDFCAILEQRGVKRIVFTDINRDGALTGPNTVALEEVLKGTTMDVIASGGIAEVGDLAWFCSCGYQNLYGIITGKALYEDKLSLPEALAFIQQYTV